MARSVDSLAGGGYDLLILLQASLADASIIVQIAVTVARLHCIADRGYRLVIGGGEMLRAPRSFGGTSGVIRFDRPSLTVFDTVMREGLEHHFCIVYGDYRESLRAFAGLVGLSALELT